MGAAARRRGKAPRPIDSKSKIKGTDRSIMNRLGRYDVDAAFDRMSLQTADEFGLDAILEQLVRAADVEGVRRLIEVSTPEGYRVPAACLRAAQQAAYVFDSVGREKETVLARSACYSDQMVVDHRRRAFDVLITLVVAADEEALCTRGLAVRFLASGSLSRRGIISWGMTALHQLAWNGDVSALARVLALPWITEKIVNVSASAHVETDTSLRPTTNTGETPLHFACMAGQSAVVRLLLRDGRASCDSFCVGQHGRLRTTPLAYAAQGLRYAEDRVQRSRLSDCVRALVTKDPRLADCSYTLHPADKLITRTSVQLASTYACLEMLYVLLLALRDFGPTTRLASAEVEMDYGEPLRGLDGVLESVKEWFESTGRVLPSVQRLTHGGAWPVFEWVLTVVNSGGSVRAWRAAQVRELLFLKRLVAKHRDRKRARAELTMTHRLFLLRDDALFLRCLEYCWFVDTERSLRYAGPAGE